eukprot:TRINITY_DN9006_c0_g1_i1.p1 TRINITY_DN9006_c0_g1~~TRINITY_DN9006_c0_g1_i1.p1  ORF type:complete len:296 (-),score=81.22 TRINITY_DN9006_c0_g1_i1:1107-1994(-)
MFKSEPAKNESDVPDVEDDVKDDNDSEVVKKIVRKPRPKLTFDMLCNPTTGFPACVDFAKTEFKGKGHEAHNTKLLMHLYEDWATKLFPERPAFPVIVDKIEKMGSNFLVKSQLFRMREGQGVMNKEEFKELMTTGRSRLVPHRKEGGSTALTEANEEADSRREYLLLQQMEEEENQARENGEEPFLVGAGSETSGEAETVTTATTITTTTSRSPTKRALETTTGSLADDDVTTPDESGQQPAQKTKRRRLRKKSEKKQRAPAVVDLEGGDGGQGDVGTIGLVDRHPVATETDNL